MTQLTSIEPSRPLLVCIHDATPVYARETEVMIRDLAPILGRRLSVGVVPNWHGRWPLTAHRGYCRFLADSADELLLHGYGHRRGRGHGITSVLAGRSDEMNGLTVEETRRTLERAQAVFADVFGAPARGFVAPAWQRGRVSLEDENSSGLDYIVGFFSIASTTRRAVPIATWTWDCGRWGWLGHVGQGVGSLLHSSNRRVPVLAIHPRDLERGFWPRILRLTNELVDAGYEPRTAAGLLEASAC